MHAGYKRENMTNENYFDYLGTAVQSTKASFMNTTRSHKKSMFNNFQSSNKLKKTFSIELKHNVSVQSVPHSLFNRNTNKFSLLTECNADVEDEDMSDEKVIECLDFTPTLNVNFKTEEADLAEFSEED